MIKVVGPDQVEEVDNGRKKETETVEAEVVGTAVDRENGVQTELTDRGWFL